MKMLFEQADSYYRDQQLQKPAMVYYDKFVHQLVKEHERVFDHMLYTIPKEPVNWQYYKFPSTFIGSQGIYDAYSYLYQSSERHAQLVDQSGIWINMEFNNLLMENLIAENRTRFRREHQIDETVTMMFASPGSDIGEVEKFIGTISGGAKLFVEKYINTQRMSADNFAVAVSVPQGNSQYNNPAGPDADAIRAAIEGQTWPCRLVVVETQEDKYQAMCVRINYRMIFKGQ